MKTCKTCDFWVRRRPALLNEDTQYFGTCENDEKIRMVNAYENLHAWEKDRFFVEIDAFSTKELYAHTYIYTGEDFGCIHWTKEEENGSTSEAT